MSFIYFIFNLIVCFCLSFIIGLERQYRHHTIGLRTSILVSIGSFLYVSFSFLTGDADITRIASQVVCGIGFLGAGVILKDGIKVRGLTTAATLWCNCAIGVLCAGGFLLEALSGTIVILFANIVLRKVNENIDKQSKLKNDKYRCHLSITLPKDNYKKFYEQMKELLDKSYINIIKDNYDISKEVIVNYTLEITKGKKNNFTEELNEVILKNKCFTFKVDNVDDDALLEEELS